VINGMRIRDSKPHGVLSVADILAESSDVGAIKVALRLGDDRFYKYIRAFGFGQQTGIELPGETRGLTKPVERWSKVSIGAISMGQEIGISALQLASLISTFANDGVHVPPRIVAGTMAPQNTPQTSPQTIAFQPAEGTRVISSLTAAQMRQMLQGVVLHGTGRKALLEGYSSAGKTGTAQKVDPATGAYSKTKYVASFAGFAPINDPQIAVVVILDSAVGLHQGGQVSAPVFQRITQQVLEYLHVPHDVQLPPNRQVLLARRDVPDASLEESSPDHLGAALDMAEASETPVNPAAVKPDAISAQVVSAALTARETGTEPDRPVTDAKNIAGSSPAAQSGAAQSVAAVEGSPSQKLPASGTVVLDVEEGGIEVPSFLGKNLRIAIQAAQEAGLDLDAVGSGTAREQSPQPGAHVAAGSRITVRFGR
jgi:cell division protein FtsI (penicillin-binding protein 3)